MSYTQLQRKWLELERPTLIKSIFTFDDIESSLLLHSYIKDYKEENVQSSFFAWNPQGLRLEEYCFGWIIFSFLICFSNKCYTHVPQRHYHEWGLNFLLPLPVPPCSISPERWWMLLLKGMKPHNIKLSIYNI